MRLSSFRVKSFKSIQDTGICHMSDTDNIIVLAGQNEAGKSAVIEALDFFGNGPSEDFERLHKRKDEDPEVICEFLLDSTDIRNILEKTQNPKLANFLTTNNQVGLTRCVTSEDTLDEVFLTDETSKKLSAFFEKNEPKKEEPLEQQGTEAKEHEPEIKTLTDLENFLFEKMREFVFYNSFDDLLPGKTTIADINKHQAVKDFQEVFGIDFAEIVKKSERGIVTQEIAIKQKASDDLNKYWTQSLELNSKYNFNVKIIKMEPIEQSTIEFLIDRSDGEPLYLEQKSNGFRWFSAFNLRLRALGVKDETIKNLILLIDEPGQGLHEKAQRDLKKVIEELGSKGAQIIYTTHYPNLIGTVGQEFARIRLVSNSNNEGTKVQNVAQFAARQDMGAKDALSPIVTAMGIQSVGNFLDSTNLNVIVEGISDHYYLSAFKKLLNENDRLRFIPACGVTNVPNLVSVLIGWGYNYKAVFDDDADSGRKSYDSLKKEFYENDHELAQEHILKISGCNGIEDIFSPKDFDKYVLKGKITRQQGKKNSEVAKGKKEFLGRIFLEKIENNEKVELDSQTRKKVLEVFNWLHDKFKI